MIHQSDTAVPFVPKGTVMDHNRITRPLGKALRFYAVIALGLVLFQGTGLLMYLVNVWPSYKLTGAIPTWMTLVLAFAVLMGFARSFVWIKIYWTGSQALSMLGSDDGTPAMADRLVPKLGALTWLLIVSCILDVLFLPAYFLSDVVLPFPIAGWRLGAVEVARVLFPQAFGFAALVLAFLTHQYGQLLKERSRMQTELELTI